MSKEITRKEKFWCTPPEIYQALDNEFNFDFDPCPFPKPENFDSLNMDWGQMNFVNPPFRKEDGGGFGPTAWVRKAIEQNKNHGKGSFIIIPAQSYVNLLLEAGAQLRSMGRIKWVDKETGEICKGPSPITGFYLPPKGKDHSSTVSNLQKQLDNVWAELKNVEGKYKKVYNEMKTPEEIKDEAETYAGLKIWIAPDNCNGQAFYEYISETSYFDGYTAAQSNMDAEMIVFTQWAQRERWAFIDADKNKKWGKYLSVNSKKGDCYEWKSSTQLLALFRKERKI